LEEETVFIFMTEVMSVEVDVMYRVRRKIKPWELASDSHGMKREDGAVYRPVGKRKTEKHPF
jgi:hypothetical protein